MKRTEINIRDPFVLVHENKYYMYGTRGETCWGFATGFDAYVSEDLENWSEPISLFTPPEDFWADRHFWAPEVHYYNNKFYMFVSFKNETECRGTQILVSESPTGPFKIHSDGPVTPRDWECLDGTLYVDKSGEPHIIFCHEWSQIKNGTVCEMKLSSDLKNAISEPRLLFSASDGKPWVRSPHGSYEDENGGYVTDGPFAYRAKNGDLLLIWSSFGVDGYTQAVAVSNNGDISGDFTVLPDLLFEKDGGHGMIFTDLNGRLLLALHSPNDYLHERPVFFELSDDNGKLSLVK